MVTLMTPVDARATGEGDVDRWLASGSLRHVPAWSIQGHHRGEGIGTFLDVFSFRNTYVLLRELFFGGHALCIIDDVLYRICVLLLARACGVPTIDTTHTDVTKLASYQK